MRIAMIAHCDAPWTPHFARFFTDRGDDLLVISFAPPMLDGVDGVRIEYVGAAQYDPNKSKGLFLTRVPRVRRLLRAFGAQVVFAPYMRSNGLTAVLASSAPVVIAAVGTDVLNVSGRRSWKRGVTERILRFIGQRAALINVVSAAIGEELCRIGVPQSRLFCLPFGVDTRRFQPAPDMPRPVATRLLSTRKHESAYDIPCIIAALAVLKSRGRSFHCTFTSSGSQLERHQHLARDAGLTECVSFTGRLPYANLPGMLAASDIYISASHSDGTSVSLLEAIAGGVFPVVSRIPANTPWVEHGRTGLLFDCGRSDQLADALDTALSDADLRNRAFGANRRRVEEEADLNRNMQRLAERLEKLATAR